MKIGIFDSGMGGTAVMHAIKNLLPEEDCLYLADSKNCPYGEKTAEELLKIVNQNVETLKAKGAKIIVIACNTATVKCVKKLREIYQDIKFVGTEPAIKLASKTDARNILVLATPGTVQSERAEELLKENQKEGQTITLLPCPGLADTIERTLKFTEDYIPLPLTNQEKIVINDKLKTLLQDISQSPDIIVLGCTHYSLIKPEIQNFFKSQKSPVKIIDGNSGVARRVAAIIKSL